MPENYIIRINGNEQREVKIRLIGIIDEDTCEALLNGEDAVRKVSTSENFDVDKKLAINKRFVAVVQDSDAVDKLPLSDKDKEALKGTIIPYLFISAKISRLHYLEGNKVLTCRGKNSFQFIPIEKQRKVADGSDI